MLGLCASALFLPFFDYGDVIWGDRGNTTLMAELQVLHNKAARSILDLLARPSLGRLRWKPLQRQKAEERHIFTYKYINNLFMHSGQCLIVVFIITWLAQLIHSLTRRVETFGGVPKCLRLQPSTT